MKIDGKASRSFTDVIREIRMEACLKQIERDPNLCLWYEDLENLIPCVITKQQKEQLMAFFTPPKGQFKDSGKLMIFGTGGDMEKGSKSFEDIFKEGIL